MTHGIACTDKTKAEPKVLGYLWSLRLCVSSYSLPFCASPGWVAKNRWGEHLDKGRVAAMRVLSLEEATKPEGNLDFSLSFFQFCP